MKHGRRELGEKKNWRRNKLVGGRVGWRRREHG
jgi:hypothetical protein